MAQQRERDRVEPLGEQEIGHRDLGIDPEAKGPFYGLKPETGIAPAWLRDPQTVRGFSKALAERLTTEERHADPYIDRAIAGYQRLSCTEDTVVRSSVGYFADGTSIS